MQIKKKWGHDTSIILQPQGHSWRGGGVLECPWPPLGRPSFEQTTYNIQVAKTPWQYLGRKSHCWKAHFFKICFFVKYFRQPLLSLVNMALHAAIIPLSPLIHEGEQQYKLYIVGDPRMVSLSVTPPLKNPWNWVSTSFFTLLILSSSLACCTILSLKPLRKFSGENADRFLQSKAST